VCLENCYKDVSQVYVYEQTVATVRRVWVFILLTYPTCISISLSTFKVPLLDGRDELEQVTKMLSILGNPPPGLFPSVAKVDRTKERVLLDRFCYLSPQGLTLLTRLLDYNPDSRWTAAQALASPYFEQDPRPSTRMPIFPSRHDGYSKSK
jgi:cell division cycle 2-like protein